MREGANYQDLPTFSYGAKAVSRIVLPCINLEYYSGEDTTTDTKK